MSDRLSELQALDWREQRAIATSLGLTKPSDKSWDEFCEDILAAEMAAPAADADSEPPDATPSEQPIEAVEEAIAVETEQPIVFEVYSTDRGLFCSHCEEQIRTGLAGLPLCPIDYPTCPRNKS